jgi:hypothetical protein
LPEPGSKERLRRFLRANVGRVIESHELFEASGRKNEFGRRIRELREDEGWRILSHNDSAELKPGQYLLRETPPEKRAPVHGRAISARLRALVFDRDGSICQMCGLSPGGVDPETGRNVRLHVGHIKDRSLGGTDELSNLRTLCSTCNQGAKNITTEKPTAIWLLGQVRRAGIEEQRTVYDFLRAKFAGSG